MSNDLRALQHRRQPVIAVVLNSKERGPGSGPPYTVWLLSGAAYVIVTVT